MIKKRLHSIRLQGLIVFIPVINFFVTAISASSNMRKLKENSIYIVFPIIIFCSVGLYYLLAQLIGIMAFADESVVKILFFIAAFLTLFLLSLGFFLYHRSIINKRIFNGEIIIENNTMYYINKT